MNSPELPRGFQKRAIGTNARDFVLMIEEMIEVRLNGYPPDHEAVELLRRKMTDYLLATDPRKGVASEGNDNLA